MPTGQICSIGLLEMGKQDTEAIADAFKFRIQEIASAVRQPTRNGSCNDSGRVCNISNTMSDQEPTNATFNEQLETTRTE